jgi:1-acyl-sn-glycerol-3-phosphate acyltransferase
VEKMTAISKKSLKYLPFYGFVCYKCGVIFIDRSKKKESYLKISTALEGWPLYQVSY